MDTAKIDKLIIKYRNEKMSIVEMTKRIPSPYSYIAERVRILVSSGKIQALNYGKNGGILVGVKSRLSQKEKGIKYEEPDIFKSTGSVSLFELKPNQCRLLTNDGLYCGELCCDRLDGKKSSWCLEHHTKLTTKPPKRI